MAKLRIPEEFEGEVKITTHKSSKGGHVLKVSTDLGTMWLWVKTDEVELSFLPSGASSHPSHAENVERFNNSEAMVFKARKGEGYNG